MPKLPRNCLKFPALCRNFDLPIVPKVMPAHSAWLKVKGDSGYARGEWLEEIRALFCRHPRLGLIAGRGLHSLTFRLNLSASCGIRGASRECSRGV